MSTNGRLLNPAVFEGDAMILLSGGIDSATIAALSKDQNARASALFVDYGQASRQAERAASQAVADAYNLPWREVTAAGGEFAGGEIRGRNAFLVHLALLVIPTQRCVLYLGIHGGTPYRDCGSEFVELMQSSLDFHTGGQVRLATPFLEARKPDIVALAESLGVPFDLTYSCEAGPVPCGSCASCRDRALLDAGA